MTSDQQHSMVGIDHFTPHPASPSQHPISPSLLGTAVTRIEDNSLLRGQATFIANLEFPDLAHVVFARSPFAHARIGAIDIEAARRAPGVIDVVTAADVDLPPIPSPPSMHPAMIRPLLPTDRVRFVGEAVVAVVAETVEAAVDAIELIDIVYEPLPAVMDPEASLRDEILVAEHAGTNIAFDTRVGNPEDFFADCDVVVDARLVNNRQAPVPLETRVSAAQWTGGQLTVWISSQRVHAPRDLLCAIYDMDASQVRVTLGDVGGSFGAKHAGTPEELLLPFLAKRIGRPVRFVESRTENLISLNHGRAQTQYCRIGGTKSGDLRAFSLSVIREAGAYPAIGSTGRMTRVLTPGCYTFDRVAFEVVAPLTNTAPTGSFRGAGRPEAAAAIERMIDLFARRIDMAPDELRRRNFIAPDQFPYPNKMGVSYDTGNYAAALEMALGATGLAELRAEQAEGRQGGRSTLVGIGYSSYVEIANPLGSGEYAAIELQPDGALMVRTGSSPHGQGLHTALAMLATEHTGIAMSDVEVMHGDTFLVPRGSGTGGSRSLQTGGSAVVEAVAKLVDEARTVAADFLEANADDVQFDSSTGRFSVAGTPAIGCGWAEVASASGGLRVEHDFQPGGPTFPFGAHVAVVDVDPETGQVTLRRFVAVDDCGVIVNPLLVHGQIHGGIASGVAQALYEHVVYDEEGTPLTTNLADYACISAAELPSFEVHELVTPTPMNPLGVKGVGESGTTGSVPAVQNAVIDALAHLGIDHLDLPLTPQRVWQAMQSATESRHQTATISG